MVAHIHPTDEKEQSVEEHCLNTARLAEQYAAAVGMKVLAGTAGKLHDMGKLTEAFDSYIRGRSSAKRGDIDHCFAGAKYLSELAGNDKMLKDTAAFLGRAVLSHHGLHDWIDEDGEDYYSKRTAKNEGYDEILENAGKCSLLSCCEDDLKEAEKEYRALTEKAFKTMGSAKYPDESRKYQAMAFYMGMWERLLTSLLTDADRTDTADFMSGVDTERHFDTKALWEEMHIRMEEKLRGFEGRNDPISQRRKSISERCRDFAENDVKICRLVVPTGGGKTLSSLRFAVEYCRKGKADKVIYVAPYLSILEQNSDEIRSVAGDDAFLEHHSDMLAEKAENAEELDEYELRTEKWDSPVIATTMVQFFNALFSGKPSAVRRMHRLSNAVIIIDEVQSIPLKCVYLFNLAMNFLAYCCNSTIVLCSATQPPFELMKAHPLIQDENPSMTGDTAEDFEAFRRTRIIPLNDKKGGYTYEEAAEFCIKKQREHGSLLMVVNTKAAALQLYKLIKENTEAQVIHLSTNMCPQHRTDKIKTLRRLLKEKAPVICVTTQLIEAGVDISFGCAVRSLAGMDNAAQAAGRCNRHGEFEKVCPVYLIKIKDEALKYLPEIANAQDISTEMLYGFDSEGETDLQGAEVMRDYFSKLYGENKEKLCYPVRGDNLLDMLSLDKERNSIYGNKALMFRGQAFRTAGGLFDVIGSNTQGVIVPYNDKAEEIITELNGECSPDKAVSLLRKAQKYTVNVYSSTLKRLEEEKGLIQLECGALAADKRYYNAEHGLSADAEERETLIL